LLVVGLNTAATVCPSAPICGEALTGDISDQQHNQQQQQQQQW